MNLQDLVTHAQENNETPERPTDFPEPAWIPLDGVRSVVRQSHERITYPEGKTSNTDGREELVLVVKPGDMIGIETDQEELTLPVGAGPGEAEIQTQGTDALAFYLPFHYYRSVWGIYLRASGIHYLAEKLKRARLAAADEVIIQAAADALQAHERHHFTVEVATTLLEVGLINGVYKIQFNDTAIRQIEEALSNVRCRKALQRRQTRDFLPALEEFMRTQGPGYRDFRTYLSPRKFSMGRRSLGEQMCRVWRGSESNPELQAIGFVHALLHVPWPWEAYHETVEIIGRRWNIPCYLILDAPLPWLRVIRPFPKDMGLQVFVYSNDHLPVHFHLFMPPGKRFGRYQWQSLEPIGSKDPPLSNRERKPLYAYLEKYRKKIEGELRQVYGSSLPK